MNPPYDKNKHLKFLEKVIKLADNAVSIQPVRWLQDPTAKYNAKSDYMKYESSISKHINDIELYSIEKAKSMFDIGVSSTVGIYKCTRDGGFDYERFATNELIDKVYKYILDNPCRIDAGKRDGYRLRVPTIASGHGGGSGNRPPVLCNADIKDIVFKDGKYNGRWWYEYYQKNQHSKTTETITHSIRFGTEQEAHNFARSLMTDFARYVEDIIITDVHVSEKKILWMGNAAHPRTGTRGYKDEWTNEDFYKYFAVDSEWQRTIEDFIKQYESRYNEWMRKHRHNK
jgi:hypothetical protein